MKKININSQKHGLVWLEVETQADVDAYLAEIEQTQHWGKPAYTEIIPAKEAVLDENGVELEPAVPEQIIEHPAEYTVEVTDITEEIKLQASIKKNLARIKFGQLIMAELAAKNQLALEQQTITTQEIIDIEASLIAVQRLLSNGSLGLALAALQATEVPHMSLTTKQEYIDKIQTYLQQEV